ncbi:amidohydrolase family enzyme [Bacillus sp. JCM 19046]|nr:amidohydrolase family enzyme [Bacillus sp. JCM 19045]GAF19029.1 amidohydrolase family enzyme [Bacillus sp. JCM 19046]
MQRTEFINLLNVETGQFEGKKVTLKNGMIVAKEDALLDQQESFVLPGLIDSHCHITLSYGSLFTAAGVTSVRNTAGSFYLLAPFFEEDRSVSLPHVYTTDRMIDGVPGLWGETSIGALATTSANVAVEEVKRQADLGASFIKVYGRLERRVMEAVVVEANRLGLEVSADLLGSTDVDARVAAKIGVRFLEHNSGVLQSLIPGWHCLLSEAEDAKLLQDGLEDDALATLCDELIKSNVALVPTLSLFAQGSQSFKWKPFQTMIGNADHGLREHWNNLRPHINQQKQERLYLLTAKITKAYHQAGGQLLAGTDTPAGIDTFPGQLLHRELELLVQCGLKPLEALQAATITPSRLFKFERELKVGQVADYIVVKENPLESISNTQTIQTIVKGGKQYTQEELVKEAVEIGKNYDENWHLEKEKMFNKEIHQYHPQLQ